MRATIILHWILHLAGAIVLVLGLLIWTLQLNIIVQIERSSQHYQAVGHLL